MGCGVEMLEALKPSSSHINGVVTVTLVDQVAVGTRSARQLQNLTRVAVEQRCKYVYSDVMSANVPELGCPFRCSR